MPAGGWAPRPCALGQSRTSANSVDEQELSSRLYRHRNAAFHVTQESVPKIEPTARPAHCHENVNAYVARHSNCHAVRGWLIGNHGTFLYFNAHSVVETPDGRLIDITPSQPACPFLRHPGSDEEFTAIITATPRLLHELPSEEWPDLSEFNRSQGGPLDE